MKELLINWRPENLEDEIVKLKPLVDPDFDNLFEVAADPLIWEQHPVSDRYKKEVFQQYFDGALSGNTAFVIIDKSTGSIIGSTRYYDYKPGDSAIAIGYTFLAKKYWGGKYNKAAKKLLLDYAFQFVEKVYFHIGAANIRSQIGTTKIGAAKIGEVEIDHYGQPLLHFEYLIQKKDWK